MNTSDLAGLKSSTSTIKWILGLLLPLFVLIVGSWVGMTYNGVQETLREVKTDVTQVKVMVNQNAIAAALSRQQFERYQLDMQEVKNDLEDHRRAQERQSKKPHNQ
jgi:hypothetical protein